MRVIVGLGNPTLKYSKTRHNVGFDTIDIIAKKYKIKVKKNQFKALIGEGIIEGEKVILVKPMTYMNNSGEAVKLIVDYYKIDPEKELIVISDDLNLDVGVLRLRTKGSAGGHNGIKNIIAQTGTDVFKRIKVGVGEKPKGYDLADYVLGHFSVSENKEIDAACEKAAEAVALLVREEVDMAMNRFN